MGYRITIGNAVPRTYTDEEDREDKEECGYSDRMAEVITLPNAPEWRDRTNVCRNSGTAWIKFAERVGLEDYFKSFEYTNCPTLRAITQDEVDMLSQKLSETIPFKDVDDWDFGQLEWFVWWMRWAIANCENPSIEID